jgi:hypothetical protein
VDKIRVTICRKTADQYGSHIPISATEYKKPRLACIRRVQKEWDEEKGKHAGTPWEPLKHPNFHLLTKTQKANGKRAAIDAMYNSLKKEIQINVVIELTDNELALRLILPWCGTKAR